MEIPSSWRRSFFTAACLVTLAISSGKADVFTVTSTNDSGPGSFAQAVANANTTFGPNTIDFNIPGPGVHTITLRPDNPIQLGDLTIDGYSQPGAQANTLAVGDNAVILIQIDGGGPSSTILSGLQFFVGASTVRGISLTGFALNGGAAIRVSINAFQDPVSLSVEGCFIGLTPDGTPRGNDVGVSDEAGSEDLVVGGTTPDKRNIISGNNAGVSGGTVLGNYIGTDITGLAQGAGNGTGVAASIVGGPKPGAGNVITGNLYGVAARDDAIIQGNLIGPFADGSPSLGNQFGVRLTRSSVTVGGLGPNEGNVIAYNGTGVAVIFASPFTDVPSKDSILSNFIFNNSTIGIDLGFPNITSNDAGDGDTGENLLQNFPIISSVTRDATSTTVTGALNSTPSSDFTLQFFAGDSASIPPAEIFLGTKTVTTSAVGNANFKFTFPAVTSDDQAITATATDAAGNTSEFFPPDGAAHFANISTRGIVGTGDNPLIAGFITSAAFISQGPTKTFLIRALGPSLGISGTLANPKVVIYDETNHFVASNDNWTDSQAATEIAASGLAPNNEFEAAVIITVNVDQLFDKGFTAVVSGAGGGTGIASVEVYDLSLGDDFFATSELINLSTRGTAGIGDDVLIGGVIVAGDAVQQVLVRAIGPDLGNNGVTGALQDPTLDLYDADGTLLVSNDNWKTDQKTEIIATGLAPDDKRDAAVLTTLFPASYTAIVRGKNDTTGIGLVEFYKID